MKRILLPGLVTLLLASAVAPAAPTVTYENFGIVTTPIMIDALNFVNSGQFGTPTFPILVGNLRPYETFDTINFTNYGEMHAEPGFRFSRNSNATGLRTMAGNFINFNPGVIQGIDLLGLTQSPTAPCAVSPAFPSYLSIWATNIVSSAGAPALGASMIVGANGELKLEGKNVDLSYSGLEVLPVWNESIGTITQGNPPTNFIPDIAIFDSYWVQGSFNMNDPLGVAGLWNGFTANSQGEPGPPNGPSRPGATPAFSLDSPFSDSYISSQFQLITLTNFTGPATNVTTIDPVFVIVRSNIVKGAIFVSVPPQFDVPQLGFTPSPQPRNPTMTAHVTLSTLLVNVVTGQLEPAFVGLSDTLASDTRIRGNAQNQIGCSAPTFRPANYLLDRLPAGGLAGNNGVPEDDFFVSSGNRIFLGGAQVISDTITNLGVEAGDYAGYGAVLDNVVSRPPPVPGGAVSNMPGRIRIIADTKLDLTSTRMRAEGSVFIDTPHLISSSNAVIDVENLSLALGATNSNLQITSIAADFVERLRGNVFIWSATWSNQATLVLTNYTFTNVVVGTNMVGTNAIPITNIVAILSPVTNQFGIVFHTTMVDARSLITVVPVTVYDLLVHSSDVVINDNLTVIQSLKFEGRSLTLNGDFTLPGAYPANPITGLAPPIPAVQNWTAANAPNLLYFTNNGTFFIFNEGHFGDDRPLYASFVNAGTIDASSISINSFYYENSGSLISVGPLFMQGDTGKLEDGSTLSGTLTRFSGNNLKFNNFQVDTGLGALFFNITNSLSDAGPGSGNVFNVNGFHLLHKPLTGDLLGTTIQDVGPDVPSIRLDHTWAGEDRGPSPAGFVDNAAIGTLVLSTLGPRPLFAFRGTGSHNGLYVDVLDLSGLHDDFENEIQINPNLVIYFAAATVPPGVTLPPNTSAEEFLDGQFNGHLRWVSSFAGPNSSQIATVNGNSVDVNSALFNSQLIDSDNDGFVNFIDVSGDIFLPAAVTVEINGNGAVVPDLNGVPLVAGNVSTISAIPADGWVFVGWTGSFESDSAQLTFTNEDGLDIIANFDFIATAATYNGLFFVSAGIEFNESGSITITTTKSRQFSGSLRLGNRQGSFSGQFAPDGTAFKSVQLKNGGSVTLELQMGAKHITGTVSDGVFVADLLADRAAFNGTTRKAPFSGKYTIIFPGSGDANDTTLPLGDGHGSINVDKAGRLQFAGTLADGTKVTQSATVSGERTWPLFAPYSNSKGQILGWMSFLNAGDSDVSGLVNWIKRFNAASIYPDGFNFSTNAIGSRLNSAEKPVTGFKNGIVELIGVGGNLATNTLSLVAIGSTNKVTFLSGDKLTLKLNSVDGSFSGTARDPESGGMINFTGAILQRQNIGRGFFRKAGQSGEVLFGP